MGILDNIRSNEPIITGVDHVAIIVENMDKSLPFYSEVLGLTILHDGRKDRGDKKSFLGIKEKAFVALTENPDKNLDQDIIESVCHIAFKVADIERAKNDLSSKGVEFIEEKANDNGKIVAYHFLDPDGLELEIYSDEKEIQPAY
ncbi:MAG: hypothetical protein GTO02_04520 [Candidatus Dadabacteria bacterium]|nr:hypothetical protein [Candidatus Dadabacteria bacterium]NIQ13683.1 hypothetical protein [Candidatus Dadabacteria bacterium]